MKKSTLTKLYILFDALSALFVWVTFALFRLSWKGFEVNVEKFLPIVMPNYSFWATVVFYLLLFLLSSYLTGFYLQREARSRVGELACTFVAALASALVAFFAVVLDDEFFVVGHLYALLLLFVLQFFSTYILRVFITSFYFFKIKKGEIFSNILILGSNKSAAQVAQNLAEKKRNYGARVVGFLADDENKKVRVQPVLGTLDDLKEVVKTHKINLVISALNSTNSQKLFWVIDKISHIQSVELCVAPKQNSLFFSTIEDIDFMPMINLSRISMPLWQQAFKRAFDVFMSFTFLILLSPVFLAVGLAVRMTSNGAAIFRQKRVGRFGKEFFIYKFRTMYLGSDDGEPRLTAQNDERVTKLGNFLRKYRIDELPQLYNILRGDMSIVGPRPERRFFIDKIRKIAPYYGLIYKVRPGLISWGPIKVGYTFSVEQMKERLDFDIFYMNNMSILMDLKLAIYTFEVIFKGKGV